MNEIEQWYDNSYDEWSRFDRHRLEFDITKRYLDKHLTEKNLEIFDIGGGPGRYSLYLAEKGHKVTLLDLSSRNIEMAKQKSTELGIRLEDYIHGNALELDTFKQEYDVVLLMGPLYHLVQEVDRRKAIQSVLRLLKPGGLLVAAFISCYAPILDELLHVGDCGDQCEDPVQLLNYLEEGTNRDGQGFTTAYFSSPEEAMELMADFGLQQLDFAGVENILGSKESALCALEEKQYAKWLEIGWALSSDKRVYGTSHHFLYIGQK